MKRLVLFVPLAVFIALVGFFYFALEMRQDRAVEELSSALIGKPFPAFEARNLQGEPVAREDLVNGEVTLVNVWGSWCPSCTVEHPYLASLVDRGVRLVGINYKDTPEEAKAWLDKYGDNYAFHIQDPQGELGIELGVYGAPETYIIDGDGIVRFKRVGVVNQRIWENRMRDIYREYGGRIDE